MEEKTEQISYFAFEGVMARMERANHRQWVIILVLIAALILTNLAWILYEAQWEVYETTTQEVTQRANSDTGPAQNTFVGGDYGRSDTEGNNEKN